MEKKRKKKNGELASSEFLKTGAVVNGAPVLPSICSNNLSSILQPSCMCALRRGAPQRRRRSSASIKASSSGMLSASLKQAPAASTLVPSRLTRINHLLHFVCYFLFYFLCLLKQYNASRDAFKFKNHSD